MVLLIFLKICPHWLQRHLFSMYHGCGSTLLAQLLSLDEQNIVLAEPPIFDEVLREIAFQKPEISEEKIDESLQAVVKFLGQKRTGKEQNFFIKLDSWHIFYYEKLRKL